MARTAGNTSEEASALLSLSGCRIRVFDYRGAQQASEQSRNLALSIGDKALAGAASVNLATIYLQLGDVAFASRQAAYAVDLLQNTPNKLRLGKAMLLYANAEAERTRDELEADRVAHDSKAERRDIEQLEKNYRKGVAIAHRAELAGLEAKLWEELGYSLLLAHLPEHAEEPLRRAYLLESESRDQDAIATNQAHRAELALQKKDYRTALNLIDLALASGSASFKTIPQFYSLHIRGVLLEKLDRKSEALMELRKALKAASIWRQGALPGDVTSTRTVVVLHDVYSDYAQLAAELSLERHNPELAREALEAVAENRAANLREQITLALSQKQQLPERYVYLLSELQAAEARVTLGENRPQDKARLEQVRLEIGGIENDFSMRSRVSTVSNERNPNRNSLRDIQARLSSNEVLLSFSLGKERSFLWTVTRSQVRVYRLESEAVIAGLATQFAQAVQGRDNAFSTGRRLSEDLFGGLPQEIWRKREWLIVADGVLLGGIPFASVADLSSRSSKQYLTESHDLRFIPSELLLLSADKVRAQRRFVGVGDPIYNIADSRERRTKRTQGEVNPAATALPRLAGSDREVRSAAKESGMPESEILVGRQATFAQLQKAIANRPQILHFAVHVITPDTGLPSTLRDASEAALALSLTGDDMPELLTPEAIATMRVPGSLVILSGCSSQNGEILPSAGLMGLSRAWLLAGASAVVVSAWPTPDDSGRFFFSFYKHFDADSAGTLAQRAAYALQQAQVEMQHGEGYRSSPKFWAAYSVISKE